MELTLGRRIRLEDLVDREALRELCESFHALFGIARPRLLRATGMLLADVVAEHDDLPLRRRRSPGPQRVRERPSAPLKSVEPGDDERGRRTRASPARVPHHSPSSTTDGASAAVLGPYLPAELTRASRSSLLEVDPRSTPARARELLPPCRASRPETITLIADAPARDARSHPVQRPQGAAHVADAPRPACARATASSQEKNEKLQEAYDGSRSSTA